MIRKLFKNLLILSLVAAMPVIAGEQDENLDAVRERIAEIFDVIEPEDVGVSPIDGWYEIQKGSVVAYVSADGRYLLQGDLIDLDAGINLTDISRNDARRNLMAQLDDSEVISFAPENPKYSVTIFTDVGCTYCRRLHSQIDEYLARGIEVRYLLYPRNGPASSEWNTSEQVWCAADRNRALTAAKLDRKFETSPCDASIVQEHYLLGREVGLSGTPAIVFEDGTLIGGYLPAEQLAQQLEQNSTAKTASR
ncbi:MAG: DsbC family protein [Gammaproteobacteria bacterium]|nr:DsbC family protein [Gammaproteobacteria bacterium]